MELNSSGSSSGNAHLWSDAKRIWLGSTASRSPWHSEAYTSRLKLLPCPRSIPEAGRHGKRIEAIAVEIVKGAEHVRGEAVRDVSTGVRALAVGRMEHPGFDPVSRGGDDPTYAIEIKGRAGGGGIALSENEWTQARNLGDRYWLHDVHHYGTSTTRFVRVPNPFTKLMA